MGIPYHTAKRTFVVMVSLRFQGHGACSSRRRAGRFYQGSSIASVMRMLHATELLNAMFMFMS
eukprot:1527380-Amphidinium_carterae.1